MSDIAIDFRASMPDRTQEIFIFLSSIKELKRWTLVGGTALAIHLKHRTSEDLDFFVPDDTLHRVQSDIDAVIKTLRNNRFRCTPGDFNHGKQEHKDFLVNDVKLSFVASGVKQVSYQSSRYKNIRIASTDIIGAMKMRAVLDYRIKSRDFYDLFTLLDQKCYTFPDLLCLLRRFDKTYMPNVTDNLIHNRFLKAKLDPMDEGFHTLKVTKPHDFKKLRDFFKTLFLTEVNQDEAIAESIIKEPRRWQEYQDHRFGFSAASMPLHFARIGQDGIVRYLVEQNAFDLFETDLFGYRVLDFYLQDPDMYRTILRYSHEITPHVFETPAYCRDETLKNEMMLEFQLILQQKNSGNTPRIEQTLKKQGLEIDPEAFLVRLKQKKELMQAYQPVLTPLCR